jgi:SSS family solute:Na+ symporter
MNSALIIIGLTAVMALALGIAARRGHDMTLEQWTVAGRGFGGLLVFLLLAGEIYTTFTFLGGSGWAYGRGAPTYYILAYGSLAYILSYWLLPPIWRYAKQERLVSQSHFFARKYDSRWLGALVALVGVMALVPYLVLQFQGLGIIVSVCSYGSISSTAAIWIGAATVTIYVMVSGMRGVAWNAVVKDILILAVVIFLGVYLPIHYYGGVGEMFHAIDAAKPGFLTFKPTGQSVLWFQSTVALTTLGFFMWPQAFAAVFTAREERILRRNAALLPLYQLILLFVFFCGFAAILQVPGLTGADIDQALLRLSLKTFDPWFVGVIGAAGLLTALVPGSIILVTAATLIANDLLRGLNPDLAEGAVARVARGLAPVIALVAVYFTLQGGQTIVALLLMGYSFVTQLFPAVVCSLMRRNPMTTPGAVAGIVVGVAAVAYITLTHSTFVSLFPFLPAAANDVNIGFASLILNVLASAVVSALTPATQPSAERPPAGRANQRARNPAVTATGWSTAALIFGVLGGLFGLLIGVFGYFVEGIAAAGGQNGAGLFQLISMAIPIASLVGGGMAKSDAVVAGILMLLSAVGMLLVFGFNFFTAIPLVLSGVGGMMALVSANDPKTKTA